MTGLYPTNPRLLKALSDEEWTELLTRLETERLPVPRELVILDWRLSVSGTMKRHHRAKLSDEDVLDIVAAITSGRKQADIAAAYGVSRQRIWQIRLQAGL
jgi:hypothetical protein